MAGVITRPVWPQRNGGRPESHAGSGPRDVAFTRGLGLAKYHFKVRRIRISARLNDENVHRPQLCVLEPVDLLRQSKLRIALEGQRKWITRRAWPRSARCLHLFQHNRQTAIDKDNFKSLAHERREEGSINFVQFQHGSSVSPRG